MGVKDSSRLVEEERNAGSRLPSSTLIPAGCLYVLIFRFNLQPAVRDFQRRQRRWRDRQQPPSRTQQPAAGVAAWPRTLRTQMFGPRASLVSASALTSRTELLSCRSGNSPHSAAKMGGTDGSCLREQKKTPGERKLPSPTPLAAQNSLLFSVSRLLLSQIPRF